MNRGSRSSQEVVSFSLTVIEHPSNSELVDCGQSDESLQFVLVHEKADRGWWLPGGGVDAGQTLAEAAVREAAEEAGCDVSLTGVLRIEFGRGRMRIFWHARPVDVSLPLKSVPDKESRGAAWATLVHTMQVHRRNAPGVEHCWLRGSEPLHYFDYLCRPDRSNVAPIAPADFILSERRGGGSVPEWAGPGDPPRAFYNTTVDVKLAALSRQHCTATPFLFYTDDPVAGLPVVRVCPADSVVGAAEDLAAQAAQCKLLGIARFEHTIDVASNTASIVVVFVAAAAEVVSWRPVSDFSESERPLLERISNGRVYPLCLFSEFEGSKLNTGQECAAQVLAIQSFFARS